MSSLAEIYEDPRRTSRDPAVLAKRAGVSIKSAKAFLREQASAQLRQRAVRPPPEAYAPSGAVFGTWAADIVYLRDYAGVNDKRAYLLILIELNSRYAYVRAMTNAKAASAAAAMSDILAQNGADVADGVAPILRVRSDNGSEFSGEFAELLGSRGIRLEHPEANTHERMGRLDRFVRTLRGLIGGLFDLTGSHRYIDALPDLIRNYNESPHRGLLPAGKGLSPADITPALEKKLRTHDLRRADEVRARTDRAGLVPGSQVRLLMRRTKAGSKDKFAKSHLATWSPDVYTVLARQGVNSYLVDVPAGEIAIWPAHALQRVGNHVVPLRVAQPEQLVDVPVVRAKRMEAHNISEVEQAAALAGPAREKRERRAPKKLDL